LSLPAGGWGPPDSFWPGSWFFSDSRAHAWDAKTDEVDDTEVHPHWQTFICFLSSHASVLTRCRSVGPIEKPFVD
jgi:hypothetical protein